MESKDKKQELYDNQIKLLNIFFKKGAISKAQYEKSCHDLTEKMRISELKKL